MGVGLFLGSAIVTLLVLLSGTGAGGTNVGAAGTAVPAAPAPEAGPTDIGVADLILPDEIEPYSSQAPSAGPPYLLRPPLTRWSEEQVQRYWVPLKEIALDHIRRENDRRVEELFEGVP
jgi:hypothetical protein